MSGLEPFVDEVAHRIDDETDEHAEDDEGHGAKVATATGIEAEARAEPEWGS